jgi:hypothetical protein
MGEGRNVYNVLAGKRPLGGLRCIWKDGIRMDLGDWLGGGCGVDLPGSGKGLVAGCRECNDGPSSSGTVE